MARSCSIKKIDTHTHTGVRSQRGEYSKGAIGTFFATVKAHLRY